MSRSTQFSCYGVEFRFNTVLKRNLYKNDVPSYLSVDGQNITSQRETTKDLMNFSQLLVVILLQSYLHQILTC